MQVIFLFSSIVNIFVFQRFISLTYCHNVLFLFSWKSNDLSLTLIHLCSCHPAFMWAFFVHRFVTIKLSKTSIVRQMNFHVFSCEKTLFWKTQYKTWPNQINIIIYKHVIYSYLLFLHAKSFIFMPVHNVLIFTKL